MNGTFTINFLLRQGMQELVSLYELESAPQALKTKLKNEHAYATWVEYPTGLFSNHTRFDSRSPRWRIFLQTLYTSSLRTADFTAEFCCGYPTQSWDMAPVHLIENPPTKPDAFCAIRGWPWCIGVENESDTVFKVRMRSLRSSLPFILNLFRTPPYNSQEDRYPPECYISTLMIRFKDLVISVDLYRGTDSPSHFEFT